MAERVALLPQGSQQIFSRTFDISFEAKRSVFFYCKLKNANGQVVGARVSTFGSNKFLEIVDPQLTIDVSQRGDQAVFSLSSQNLARFVALSLAGEDMVFSDNYFDILPGEPVELSCPIPQGWKIGQVRLALQVISLFNSF